MVITNHESALKNALTETLEARQQLYIFHQNKNAILNIKRKWIGSQVVDDPGHLYRYDEAGNPLPTQTASQEGATLDTLDAEDRHELKALNAYARTRTSE